MSDKPIIITGHVRGVSATDAARLTVVALRGDTIVARAGLRANGHYRLTAPHKAAREESAYALQVAAVPTTALAHVDKVPGLPRVSLSSESLREEEVEAPSLSLSEEILSGWEIFWPEWCVSGTVVGPTGCPAPGAAVTVYTVSWTSGGYVETAQATVTTGPDGSFTLCFPWWDFGYCWPCEPFWWLCWPWWWEEDILHVISALETRAAKGQVAVFQPDAKSLMRGQGFPTARVGPATPDPARAALIARKLANPALREIFPWWWWCCDGPNIVFSVSQGATTILDEDPAINTRWCMESGQTVTLTGNASTQTTCNQGTLPESGVLWIQVGTTTISQIDADGCAQYGGDASDVAFAGTLSLFANAAIGAFNYYQVNAAVWDDPGFRGGTKPAPGTGSPVVANLWQMAWIYDPATLSTTGYSVQMGPFTQDGVTGLYITPAARQNPAIPTPPGLSAFPPIPPGGTVYWQYQVPCLMLQCDATVLLGGASFGAVDLTIVGYADPADPPVTLTPDAPLTLMIDATPLTTVEVGSPSAWVPPGVPAPNTGTGECPAYDVGPSGWVTVPVDVVDNNGFLLGYYLEVDWGNSNSASVTPEGEVGYASHANATRDWTGGPDTYTFPGTTPGVPTPPADCCYEFRLWFGKRVTNGYYVPTLTDLPPTFQTINLKFSS